MQTETARPPARHLSDNDAILRRLALTDREDEAYCVDVLTQVAAVTKALEGVSLRVLADHTNHCVRDAVERGGDEADAKVAELLSAVERFARSR